MSVATTSTFDMASAETQAAVSRAAGSSRFSAANWCELLLREGYCIIPGLLPSVISRLDVDLGATFAATPFCTGGFYGERTKRFGGLLTRSRYTAQAVQHELILEIAESVLGPWSDCLQLNLTQGLALHPGALPQAPHRDQDMWRGDKGRIEYLLNVMWPFTPYRKDNGATVLWPRSHGPAALESTANLDPVVALCDPGDALLFLGSTLHGGGGNVSRDVRRGMIVSYCLGWLKPFENQWLVYPPSVARDFDSGLAALVGYRQHRPNLGNVEGRCPSTLLDRSGSGRNVGAVDALSPDHAATVARFVESQTRRC